MQVGDAANPTICSVQPYIYRTGAVSGTVQLAIYADAAGPVPGAEKTGTSSAAMNCADISDTNPPTSATAPKFAVSYALTNEEYVWIVLKFSVDGGGITWRTGDYASGWYINYSDNSGSTWPNSVSEKGTTYCFKA